MRDDRSRRATFWIVGGALSSSLKAISIIAVEGDGPIEEGDDGVVEYSSVHIHGVEPELVVRSFHSTQGVPQTIGEVRAVPFCCMWV